jgi:hypothetical protein
MSLEGRDFFRAAIVISLDDGAINYRMLRSTISALISVHPMIAAIVATQPTTNTACFPAA